MTLTQIKKTAMAKGIEIKKCNFTLNSQTAYKVSRKDGSWDIFTKNDLIVSAMSGHI